MNKLLIIIVLILLCSINTTIVSADNRGDNEGCPASYWAKTDFYFTDVQGRVWTTRDQVDSVFGLPARLEAYKAIPLTLALNFPDDNPDERLIKEGVAGFLNAANDDIGYPYKRGLTPLASISGTLANGSTAEIIGLAVRIQDANDADCPFAPRMLPDGGDSVLARAGIAGIIGVLIGSFCIIISVWLSIRMRSKGA